METLLLLVIIMLQLLDVADETVCPSCSGTRTSRNTPNQVRSADLRMKRLTDQAVRQLLDEARRYEPRARQ